MGIGTPLICSDIQENKFITKENALHFKSGNSDSLKSIIEYSLNEHELLKEKALLGKSDIINRFNWEVITDQYIELLKQ